MGVLALTTHAAKVLLRKKALLKIGAGLTAINLLKSEWGDNFVLDLAWLGIQDTPKGTRRLVSKLIDKLTPINAGVAKIDAVWSTLNMGFRLATQGKKPKKGELEYEISELLGVKVESNE